MLEVGGGQGIPDLRPSAEPGGEPTWSDATRTLVTQLVRRSISLRASTDARFHELGRAYEARASAQGPDRALVVIRAVPAEATEESSDTTGERPRPQLDRRGFMRRLKEAVTLASLQEKSLSVAVLYVDGIADIARIISARISEQVLNTAILRLSAFDGLGLESGPAWQLGQLGENALALVIETGRSRGYRSVCFPRCARSCESRSPSVTPSSG
ncbi:MAG: hypothetical protein WDO56_04835 [Gammaproteobacteria bacterium]